MRVLCIDDNAAHARLLELCLDELTYGAAVFHHVESGDAASGTLAEDAFDVVFLDYDLASERGTDVLRRIRGEGYHGTVIFLTSHGDPALVMETAREGGDDFVVKSTLNVDSVRDAVKRAKTSTLRRNEHREKAMESERLAQLSDDLTERNMALYRELRTDDLTGLMTRNSWAELVQTEHRRAERFNHWYGIIIADVDYFKAFNDTAGHPAGDDCLKRVAACLANNCRQVDSVGRYGGEEFVVLAPETGPDGLVKLSERLRSGVEDMGVIHPGRPGECVTISAGGACGPADTWFNVLERADRQLYAAKAMGRNGVEIDWAV